MWTLHFYRTAPCCHEPLVPVNILLLVATTTGAAPRQSQLQLCFFCHICHQPLKRPCCRIRLYYTPFSRITTTCTTWARPNPSCPNSSGPIRARTWDKWLLLLDCGSLCFLLPCWVSLTVAGALTSVFLSLFLYIVSIISMLFVCVCQSEIHRYN